LLVAGIVDCGLGHGGSSFASDGRARGRSPSLRAWTRFGPLLSRTRAVRRAAQQHARGGCRNRQRAL